MAHVHTVHPYYYPMPYYPTTLPPYPPTNVEALHARIWRPYEYT